MSTSTSAPSTIASSSRLPGTPVKKEAHTIALAESSSSAKKRKIADAGADEDENDDDEDLEDSSVSSASPSKPTNTGGRRKASDEERKARLEARQARNRLSAQYSRERKKAYVDQLEGSVNTLKAENALLRQQRDQDQLIQKSLEAKLKDSRLRINTLESILRTVAPSLVPLIMSSSSPNSSTLSPSSAYAASSSSLNASQIDSSMTADLVSAALLQNNDLANKHVSSPVTVAAPASTVSSSLSLDTLSQPTSNEGVRLPAAEATCSDAPSLSRDAELEQSQQRMAGNNVDVNGSSIVNQGYPPVNQISVPAAEQPSQVAAISRLSLPQHSVEAKAGVAREAETLLASFIDLDAKFANGHEAIASQDQGATKAATEAQLVPMGQDNAAAADGGQRSAAASAGDHTGLSISSGLVESGINSQSNDNGELTKFNSISLATSDDSEATSQVVRVEHEDLQDRFQLLDSPLLPNEKNMWELATDAMLQDIYNETGRTAFPGSEVESGAPSVSAMDSDVSAGSSPFDLVDLDIEIEEPLQLNIGLDENEAIEAMQASHVKADTSMDWPGLFASLVA